MASTFFSYSKWLKIWNGFDGVVWCSQRHFNWDEKGRIVISWNSIAFVFIKMQGDHIFAEKQLMRVRNVIRSVGIAFGRTELVFFHHSIECADWTKGPNGSFLVRCWAPTDWNITSRNSESGLRCKHLETSELNWSTANGCERDDKVDWMVIEHSGKVSMLGDAFEMRIDFTFSVDFSVIGRSQNCEEKKESSCFRWNENCWDIPTSVWISEFVDCLIVIQVE